MTAVREALARMLRHHEPFPAMVIDRAWNLVMTHEANVDISARLSPVLATHFRIAGQDLRLFAMLSRFDMPRDLTAEDLRVETLYPADADSERLLREQLLK